MGVQISGDTGNVLATKGTYTGNLTVGGVLTYEDVTNVDSVGLVTARSGIEIGARPGVAASISVDGNMIVSGISTFNSRVLLGTTTEGEANADDLTIAGSGHVGITIRAGTTSQSAIYMSDATSGGGEYVGNIIYDHSDNHMRFATAETEKLRITGIGSVGVGINAPTAQFQVNSTKNAETDRHDATNYHLALRNPADDNGEAIGLSFGITSNATKVGASILHERDGGGSQGSLQFYTSSDGNSLSERLRITSSGHISQGGGAEPSSTNGGIGLKYGIKSSANNVIISETTSSSSGHGLHLESRQTGRGGNARIAQIGLKNDADGNGLISIFTSPSGADVSERIRIESAGNVKIYQKLNVVGVCTANSFEDSIGDMRAFPVTAYGSNVVVAGHHAGKTLTNTSGGWTINASTDFATGEVMRVVNKSGSSQSVYQGGTATVYSSRDNGTSGDHSIKARGSAIIICTGTDEYYVSGDI